MKKKIRAFYILSSAVVILTIACLITAFVFPDSAEEESQSQIIYQVTDYSVAEAGAVAVTNRNGTFGLMCYNDGTVELIDEKGNGSTSCSQTELRSLVYAICHIHSVRKISSYGNLDDYGYASPSSTVVLFLNSGESVPLLLLNQSPADNSHYLYRQDTGELFLLDEATSDLFLRSAADFTEHSVFPDVPAADLQTIEEVSYQSASGENWIITGKEGSFALSEPIEQKVRTSVVYSRLVAPLSALYGDTCLAASDGLEEYGFQEYDEMYAMTVAGKKYAAAFRKTDGRLLMANLETGSVYEISSDAVSEIASTVFDLMDGKAFYYSLGDCRTLTITDGKRDASFDVKNEENEITVTCQGRELTRDEVIELSKAVNGVSIAVQTNVLPDAPAELEILFTMESGNSDRISFLPADRDYSAVSVNGIVNFTAPKADTEPLKDLLDRYAS